MTIVMFLQVLVSGKLLGLRLNPRFIIREGFSTLGYVEFGDSVFGCVSFGLGKASSAMFLRPIHIFFEKLLQLYLLKNFECCITLRCSVFT